MRRRSIPVETIAATIVALMVAMLCATDLQAGGVRTATHLVTIEVDARSGDSRQYDVQVLDGDSRSHLADLRIVTTGDLPSEAAWTAGAITYRVRLTPFGESSILDFTAVEEGQVIDEMRASFTAAPKPERIALPVTLRTARDVDTPAILHRVEPVYTAEARAAGAAGNVILEVVIDRGGMVQDVTILGPMGHGLTESAIEAIQQWQFAPPMVDGIPVAVVHEIALEFHP